MPRPTRVALTLLGGALTASCTLGPNYKRPVVETPAVHRGATPATAGPESLADLKWFELFHDDQLTALVSTALKENFEVRIAAERVLQARAAYGITRADQFRPWASLLTRLRHARRGAARTIRPAGADTSVSYMDAGFTLGWELDVWGRLRRLSEAARAQYLATDEARHGVLTTLVADVTQTYLSLRALDFELNRHTYRDAATNNMRLIDERRTAGVASGLDVHQAEQLLFTATGQIADLERQITGRTR